MLIYFLLLKGAYLFLYTSSVLAFSLVAGLGISAEKSKNSKGFWPGKNLMKVCKTLFLDHLRRQQRKVADVKRLNWIN